MSITVANLVFPGNCHRLLYLKSLIVISILPFIAILHVLKTT